MGITAILVLILSATVCGCAIAGELDSSRQNETVIVHIGDSITSTIYLTPEERIDVVLQQKLAAAFPDKEFANANLGLDGEWVEAFLENRYESVLRKAISKADIFIIRYGANDAQREKSPEAFTEDLRTLIEKLRNDYSGCSIVLGTGPHIKELPWCNTEQYGHHWQAIRDLGAADGYPVAEIFGRFEKEHQREEIVLGKNDDTKDLHPNAKGVAMSADELMNALKPVLADRGVL